MAHFFVGGVRRARAARERSIATFRPFPPARPAPEPVIDTKAKGIEDLIAPSLAAMGYGVVRIRMTSGDRPTLQIMVEPVSDVALTLDGCAEVSRQVSALLDVEDPIGAPYNLEVSSPGIDRPLVKVADFQRFTGFEARIEAAVAIDGRRRFKGRLEGIAGDAVRIVVPGEVASRHYEIPIDGIVAAKLVLNDDLIRRTKELHARSG